MHLNILESCKNLHKIKMNISCYLLLINIQEVVQCVASIIRALYIIKCCVKQFKSIPLYPWPSFKYATTPHTRCTCSILSSYNNIITEHFLSIILVHRHRTVVWFTVKIFCSFFVLYIGSNRIYSWHGRLLRYR